MTFEHNFTVNCVSEGERPNETTRVASVINANGEDITAKFLEFCNEHGMPLTSEENIEEATYAYGRKFFR